MTSSKPKKGSGKPSGAAPATSPTDVASLDDLKRQLTVLEQAKIKEERARNYLQLERDRILDFWGVTKTRLADATARARALSLQIETQQAEHAANIKAYRDRIRALTADHAAQVTDLKAGSEAAVAQVHVELERKFEAREQAHRAALHEARAAQQVAEEAMARAQLECEARIAAAAAEQEAAMAGVQAAYDEKLHVGLSAAEQRYQASMQEASARRDAAVSQMSGQQEALLSGAREHHAATLAAQLDLIATLRRDLEAATAEVQRMKRLAKEPPSAARPSPPCSTSSAGGD